MFGMNFFPEVPRPFKTQYRCNSVSMMPGQEREELEQGGKIILPPSALDQLTRLNIVYPMLFKLTNTAVSLDIVLSHELIAQRFPFLDRPHDALRRPGVRGGRGQGLHPLLDDAEPGAGRERHPGRGVGLAARRIVRKVPATLGRLPRPHQPQGSLGSQVG